MYVILVVLFSVVVRTIIKYKVIWRFCVWYMCS